MASAARLSRMVAAEDFRRAARRRLPRIFFDYIDGGASAEATLAANVADFGRYRLRPQVLRDVAVRRLDADFLGGRHALPLMLGPVVLGLSLFGSHLRAGADGAAAPERPTGSRLALHRLVPWFILAFLAMAALRSLGAIPEAALAPIARLATILTIISMAALGLGVDIRVVARAGGRVTAAVTLSLVVLGGVSLGLIRFLGIG